MARARLADVRASKLRADDLVHWRPRVDWIPVYARVVTTRDDSVAIRLRESHEICGAAGDLVNATPSDVARAFDVGESVAAYAPSGEETARGVIRRATTTSWPPTFTIERADGTTFEATGEAMARATDADDATRKMARDAATRAADARARALVEEERVEREREAERARRRRERRDAASGARATREATRGDSVDAVEVVKAEIETEAAAAAARASAAAARAAAKAAARRRQEEIKAAKAARERAAKREAQRARKAAERAATRETTEARDDAATRDDEAPAAVAVERADEAADEGTVDVARAVKAPAREDDGDVARASEDDAKAATPRSTDEAKPPLTETRRRKLEKAEKKARRMAEIDAFLRAHEVAAQEEASREEADGDASNGAARRRKNKKKKKPTAAGDGVAASAEDTARVSQEWFAAFAVISFFAVVGAGYSFYSFVARKAFDAFAS